MLRLSNSYYIFSVLAFSSLSQACIVPSLSVVLYSLILCLSLSDVSWASLFMLVSLFVSMGLATRDCVSLCQMLAGLLSLVLSVFVNVYLCLFFYRQTSTCTRISIRCQMGFFHYISQSCPHQTSTCAHENLYLRCQLSFSSISVSVVRVCLSLSLSNDVLNSLSTNVSKGLLFLCLILSLIIFSNLLYECTNVNFTVNASFYYVTST